MKACISVAQLGARRHYAVPRALHEAGLLDTLYTDLVSNRPPASWLLKWGLLRGGTAVGRRLAGRVVRDVPSFRIRHYPFFGIKRVLGRRAKRGVAALAADYLQANQRFGDLIAKSRMDGADAMYAFNGAALEVFTKAKELGIGAILDQTSAPLIAEEELLQLERDAWPGWEEDANPAVLKDVASREQEEWELADAIICGSDYVKRSVDKLSGLGHRCVVVPYGAEPVCPSRPSRGQRDGVLNVLYVGHARLLKGVQYFMKAAQLLESERIQFRMVGQVQLSASARERLSGCVQLVDPVPHAQIGEHYTWADVLVVPSLSEGSANVAYEALSCGLPVIATEHAGTVVEDGADGFIVPVRSGERIAEALLALYRQPEKLIAFSEHARKRAVDYTPEAYARRLVEAVVEIHSMLQGSRESA